MSGWVCFPSRLFFYANMVFRVVVIDIERRLWRLGDWEIGRLGRMGDWGEWGE